MIINTRSDLEALRGTPEWPVTLRMLAGATVNWRNTAPEGEASVWEQSDDLTLLTRLGVNKDWLSAELSAANISIDPPQAPAVTAPPPAPVPAITKAQCLLWLLQQGKTEADVDAAIAAITDSEARSVAEIEWKYRQLFHSDHPLFAQLAPALGIDVSALPDAFRAAAQL